MLKLNTKDLSENIKKEFRNSPIQVSGAALVILLQANQALSYLVEAFFPLSHKLATIQMPPVLIDLPIALMSMCLLVLSLSLSIKKNKRIFFPELGIYGSHEKREYYCPQCTRSMRINDECFVCLKCGSSVEPPDIEIYKTLYNIKK